LPYFICFGIVKIRYVNRRKLFVVHESILIQILDEIKIIRNDISTLKTDVSGLKEDVSALKTDVSGLKEDVSTLKTDVSALKTDVSALKTDVSALKTDVSGLKEDVSTLKTDVSQLKAAQEEDHLILKALEHKAETNKAEHDKMLIDISQIHGYYKSVSENIDAIKEVIGRHEIDITVLKRRPV